MAGEKIVDVNCAIEAGGGAAGDQAAANGEAADAVFPCGLADVFEDYFDAAAIGEAFYFVGDFLRGVIDDGVCAEFAGLFAVLRRSRRWR